jgi:hypothetical protein
MAGMVVAMDVRMAAALAQGVERTATRENSSRGAGERLFEKVGDPVLEPIKVVASPAVTHVKYRVMN